jgi:hypothetical protein
VKTVLVHTDTASTVRAHASKATQATIVTLHNVKMIALATASVMMELVSVTQDGLERIALKRNVPELRQGLYAVDMVVATTLVDSASAQQASPRQIVPRKHAQVTATGRVFVMTASAHAQLDGRARIAQQALVLTTVMHTGNVRGGSAIVTRDTPASIVRWPPAQRTAQGEANVLMELACVFQHEPETTAQLSSAPTVAVDMGSVSISNANAVGNGRGWIVVLERVLTTATTLVGASRENVNVFRGSRLGRMESVTFNRFIGTWRRLVRSTV